MRVPVAVIDAPVSDRAFRLWCFLSQYGGPEGSRLYRQELAELLNCSRASVDRATRELVRAGLLRWEEVTAADGGRDANRWVPLDGDAATLVR